MLYCLQRQILYVSFQQSIRIAVLNTETNIVSLFSTKYTNWCTEYRDKYCISLFSKVFEMLYWPQRRILYLSFQQSIRIALLNTETNIVSLFSTKYTNCSAEYRDKYCISLFQQNIGNTVLNTETNILVLLSTKYTKCCTDYRDKYRISLSSKVFEMLYWPQRRILYLSFQQSIRIDVLNTETNIVSLFSAKY